MNCSGQAREQLLILAAVIRLPMLTQWLACIVYLARSAAQELVSKDMKFLYVHESFRLQCGGCTCSGNDDVKFRDNDATHSTPD